MQIVIRARGAGNYVQCLVSGFTICPAWATLAAWLAAGTDNRLTHKEHLYHSNKSVLCLDLVALKSRRQ
jgi:hypothetical protein